MRISDWSSDVCSSDLVIGRGIFIPADAERSRFARTARTRFAVAFAFTRRRGALFLRLGHQPRAVLDRDRAAAADQPRRGRIQPRADPTRSEEHTSELQSLMRISYAVFCLKKKNTVARQHYAYDHYSHK